MHKLRFKAVIEIYNGNPYVLVTADQAKQLRKDWKKPMPVTVQINGKPDVPWKINMIPIGNGDFYLYLHGDVRRASNTKVGDQVTADVSFDESYRNGPQHPMPEWFQHALNDSPRAAKAWSELIPSRQKEILRYFSWLKSPDAKERNLQKALYVLNGNDGRFMARSWKNGK